MAEKLLMSDDFGLAVCRELGIDPTKSYLVYVATEANLNELMTLTLKFNLTVEQFQRIAANLSNGNP